ncbi:type IV pilus modification PilV family protein [Legionella londiniensis]|uniref:Uncharacterized protein n=1 Tax=Legionella londiniensis TaxID=45068 RepID=A0A0W0VIC8_9GAMM|nr:type II secretion system protein [Legionella londiniensis]KTD19874.1 hypothetical protein Llon_2046 [Legionella londiniensis]STX94253.1 Uncharacterised protein [Legionella londiniensis]
MKRQQGFLSLATVVVIVIFAILSATLVSMFIRASAYTVNLSAIPKASALAESGLEQGRANLTEPALADRQTCAGLANLTSLPTGNFTVSPAVGINPRYAFATLSTAIASSGTPASITVTDGSVFVTGGGRVLIGREVFQYQRVNGNILTGISRAEDGSTSASHPEGALVSQYQCNMASIGNAPANNPQATREYQQGMQQPAVFAAGSGGTILRWNSPTNENAWESMSPGAYEFNAISMINYHEGWAVADTQARVARLQGNAWTLFQPSFSGNRDLYGVDAPSESEAWAVGSRQGNEFTIVRWVRDGSNSIANWCLLPCSGKTVSTSGTGSQQRDLFGIKTLDYNNDGFADIGWAVGGRDGTGSGNRGIIMVYDGAQWASSSLPPAANRIGRIYGVDAVANGNNPPVDVYFVSRSTQNNTQGKLFRWRNGSWSVVTTSAPMHSVSVIDTNNDGLADFGMAVGDNGVVYSFDVNFAVSGPISISGQDLRGVDVISTTNAWIVGNGGVRFHYDGSSFVLTGSGGSNLNGVSGVAARQSPVSSWQDVFN